MRKSQASQIALRHRAYEGSRGEEGAEDVSRSDAVQKKPSLKESSWFVEYENIGLSD